MSEAPSVHAISLIYLHRYALGVSSASFVNQYAGPIALQRIGWRYVLLDHLDCGGLTDNQGTIVRDSLSDS